MMGKMFSVVTPIVPFCITYIVLFILSVRYNTTKMPDGNPTDILAEQESVCDSLSNYFVPAAAVRSVFSGLTSTVSTDPVGHSPSIRSSASLSSTYVWMARFRGRAPYSRL